MERMAALHLKVREIAPKVTDELVAIVKKALPFRTALHEAQETYKGVRTNASKLMSKAGALLEVSFRESQVAKMFSDTDPDVVQEDTFKAQWRIIRGIIVTEQVGKKADKKVRAAAEKAVNRLQGLWSAAARVCRSARADKLAQWRKNGHPNLQAAYRALLEKDRAGQPLSDSRIESLAETLNAAPIESLREIVARVKGIRDALATVKLPKREKAPKA